MQTFMYKTFGKLTAALVLVAALFGAGFNLNVARAASCTPTVIRELWARVGTATLYGNTTVAIWGYANTADGIATLPGPVLDVNAGDCVQVTLHNVDVPENTSLFFQGQALVPDTAGVVAGGSATYIFSAANPGTFLYEAGLTANAPHQVAMGMYGALVIRPGAAGRAYANASTSFTRENILVLSEYDSAVAANPASFDMRNFNPDYLLINGRAYPGASPFTVAAGDTVLLRYVNAGLQAHSMSALGLTQTIIAQDGHPIKSRKVVAETIATGQTLDTLVAIPAGATTDTKYVIYDANMLLRNNTGGGTLGGMLTMLTVGTPASLSDATGPIAKPLSVLPNPADGSLDVIVSATINDITTGGSNVSAAEFYIDSVAGTPIAMTGAFGSPTVSVSGAIPTATLGLLASGDHPIYIRGQDSAGNWGAFASIKLTVTVAPPMATSFYLSASGITGVISGIGSDAGDIYFFDGSSSTFSLALDAPAGANVDGFDRLSDTAFYMSFSVDNVTVGGISAQAEDVVYFDGANWSLYFDGSAYGLADANIDAINAQNGALYFSLSDGTLPTGVTDAGDGADIYAFSAAAVTRFMNATALGFSSHNVDGFVYVDAAHFYLSYSPTTTPVAGLGMAQDEDIIYYNNGIWETAFDGTAQSLTVPSLDVDAFDIP